jgi:AcrR family transcriptional regulator
METATHFHLRENRSLKEACLDEALKCLSRGEKNFSLRDIARKLGVSHGAPYKHFKTKEDLLAALAEQGFAELCAELRSEVDSAHSEIEKIMKFGFCFQKFGEFHPQKLELMFDSDVVDSAAASEAAGAYGPFEKFREAIAILAEIVDDLESQGKLSADVKAKDLVSFIWTWNLGLAQALKVARSVILGAPMSLTEKKYRDLAMPLISSVQI